MLNFVEFLSSSDDEEEENIHKEREEYDAHSNEENVNPDIHQNKQQPHSTKQQNTQKKKETIAAIKQLKTHILALEKEKKSQLFSKRNKSNSSCYKELEETESKFNSLRQKEYDLLKDSLEKTAFKLQKFKHDKVSAEQNPTCLEKLKILMEEIESSIMQMKEKQKLVYEDLMVDEKNLCAEIEQISRKIDNWSTVKLTKEITKQNRTDEDEENQQPEEVILFQKFLQVSGGHYGGWDEIDHQTFIKLQKQYKKREQFLRKALEDIPTQSEEDIIQHIEWFEQYCVLKERKREAIRHWKKLKMNEKENLLHRNDKFFEEKEEIKKKKREELFEKERQERMEKLNEWKERKNEESEVKEKELERKREEEEKLKFRNLMEEKRRLETKIQIQEYKLKKREEEDILRQIEEENEKRQQKHISKLELERIRERNDKFMDQKRAREMSVKIAEDQKEERLRKLKENVIVKVDRDPDRLLRPTEGWKRRKDDTQNHGSKNNVITGTRALPHRAVPSWRQGMS